MMTIPATKASSVCHVLSITPTVDAPAPSATNTVVKPSTNARPAPSSAPRAICGADASPPARKSSTETPAM